MVLRELKPGEQPSRYAVKHASLNKLVELLSTPVPPHDGTAGSLFTAVIITTYRSFVTPEVLLEKLMQRFDVPQALIDGSSDPQAALQEANGIRHQVCVFLRHWFTGSFRDFEAGTTQQLQQFLEKVKEHVSGLPHTDKLWANVRLLEKAVCKKLERGTYSSMFSSDMLVSKPPPPILPKEPIRWASLTFMDIDALEFARQLTIADFHLYADLQPIEFFNLAWSKPALRHLAPNISQLVARFNMISEFTASLIMSGERRKLRVAIFEKLLDVAHLLLQLGNYNSLMAILGGLNNSSVHRLAHTSASLSTRSRQIFESLSEIMSSSRSYASFRAHYLSCKPPAIPFIGVYLTDLTFIEDGNPNEVGELVNFSKRVLVHTIIVDVLRYQNVNYQLKLIPQLQSFISKLPRLPQDDLYATSLILEPRNAKKKDIK